MIDSNEFHENNLLCNVMILCSRLLQRFQPLFMVPGIVDKPQHRCCCQCHCQYGKPQLQKINLPIDRVLSESGNKHQRAGNGNFLLLTDGDNQLKSHTEIMAEKHSGQKSQQYANHAAFFHTSGHMLVPPKA